MAEPILTTEDLLVLGGPASINVELDFGKAGIRGSTIVSGLGPPSEYTVDYTTLQLNDMYLNVNASDPEYGYVYQYRAADDGTFGWEVLLRLASTANLSSLQYVTFTAGVSNPIEFDITYFVPDDVRPILTAQNFNVQYAFQSVNPLDPTKVYPIASQIYTTELEYTESPLSLVFSVRLVAAKLNALTGVWAPVDGEMLGVHMTISGVGLG